MEKEKRNSFVWFFIGHNRTGKTVTAKKLAKEYIKNNPKNNIIKFDPQKRFRDIKGQNILEENWSAYFKGQTPIISDTLFIIDDYRALMDANTTDPDFLKLLMQRDEYGLDFIFAIHSPKLIHERISYYITHISIYYISGDNASFKKSGKVADGATLKQVSDFVNQYVREHGKGSYNAETQDGDFPHVICDLGNEELIFKNFKGLEFKKDDFNNKTVTTF